MADTKLTILTEQAVSTYGTGTGDKSILFSFVAKDIKAPQVDDIMKHLQAGVKQFHDRLLIELGLPLEPEPEKTPIFTADNEVVPDASDRTV